MSEADLRAQVKEHISSIKGPVGIYDLFKKLNYPKKAIFDPTYIKKLSDFELAKEEKEKIKRIYTVMSVDKLNVFLAEVKSLESKQFLRYLTRVFSGLPYFAWHEAV